MCPKQGSCPYAHSFTTEEAGLLREFWDMATQRRAAFMQNEALRQAEREAQQQRELLQE